MSDIIKHYENRQADYTHRYVMKFCRESAGYFTIWCLERPADPRDKGVTHHHLYTRLMLGVGSNLRVGE